MFANPDGDALTADRLAVNADMFLSKAQCTGQVGLVGAHIGGTLDCSEAGFSNPDGVALTAERLVVGAAMSLFKAQCTGQVELTGAHITGTLD